MEDDKSYSSSISEYNPSDEGEHRDEINLVNELGDEFGPKHAGKAISSNHKRKKKVDDVLEYDDEELEFEEELIVGNDLDKSERNCTPLRPKFIN